MWLEALVVAATLVTASGVGNILILRRENKGLRSLLLEYQRAERARYEAASERSKKGWITKRDRDAGRVALQRLEEGEGDAGIERPMKPQEGGQNE